MRQTILIALVLSAVVAATFFSCADDPDDADGNNADDNDDNDESDNDDEAAGFDDDDDDDDDAGGFDDDDDTDGWVYGPVLSNGLWDPNPIAQDPDSGDWVSFLVFDVCDSDDNLSGGQIFMYVAGTIDSFLAEDVYWDDFSSGAPSAPDCSKPKRVGIEADFSGVQAGTYCFDLEATDGDGCFSNKLTDICVIVPFP
jgi:hypothetical protein